MVLCTDMSRGNTDKCHVVTQPSISLAVCHQVKKPGWLDMDAGERRMHPEDTCFEHEQPLLVFKAHKKGELVGPSDVCEQHACCYGGSMVGQVASLADHLGLCAGVGRRWRA